MNPSFIAKLPLKRRLVSRLYYRHAKPICRGSSAVTNRRFRKLERGERAVAREPRRFRIFRCGNVFHSNADVARLSADFDQVRVVLERGIGDYLQPSTVEANTGHGKHRCDVDVCREQRHAGACGTFVKGAWHTQVVEVDAELID